MSKWKCEICNSSFENFDARGFDNKIYCPLCYYKKLYKDTELERERLKTQLQQKENIIKEVRDEMERAKDISVNDEYHIMEHEKKLLEILDKVEGMREI